jgi:CheY-like chemotaxis protein
MLQFIKLKAGYTMEENKASACINLKTVTTAQQQNVFDAPIQPITAPLKVLIVDDNPINLNVAKLLLKTIGCEVYTANSGKEGIEKLREQSIACVFMDCQMPELSGFETTQLIRQGEAGLDKSKVFISALTAYTDLENKVLCYESGMNHFVSKPVKRQSLIKALDVLRSGRSPNLAEYEEYGTSCLTNQL